MQVNYMIESIDNNKDQKVYLDVAIRFAKHAQDSVTPETIKNCFRHTEILPENCEFSVSGVTEDYAPIPRNLFEQIGREFSIDTSVMMTTEEFINCDKNLECSEVLTNEEILDIVQDKEEEVEEYDNELLSVPAPPPTTSKEARDAIVTLTRYFEQNKYANEDDITNMNKLMTRVNTLSKAASSQSSIVDYFKKQN